MAKGLDPKAVASRITAAKKKVASMDPTVKQKLKEMYPPVNTKKIIGGGLTSKTINAVRGKKATPPPAKPVIKKSALKAKTTAPFSQKAKPKPKATLSKSEKDFIAGQKFKAKIVKKTGVYPNTAR